MNTLNNDVLAAQQGNIQAFERLIAATKNTVVSIALAIVRDVDASEDVAQQVFVNCWNNLTTLKNSHSFLPWLRQSTRYMAINYLRDNKVSSKASNEEAEQVFAQLSSEQEQPDLLLSQEQKKQAVAYLLETLPDESREVVTLYYREQQSTPMVAELLGLSEAAIRKKLSRARANMREEAMAKYGRMILSTAPTASFIGVVTANLALVPEAAASTAAAGQSSFWSKLSTSFGAGLFGLLTAVLAISLSHKKVQENLTRSDVKLAVNRLKNLVLGWLVGCVFLLFIAFEQSTSPWPAILVYALLSVGLVFLTKRIQSLIYIDLATNEEFDSQSSSYKQQKLWGAIGLYTGLTMGCVGILVGLYANGRL